jgi:hypothetical protein
MVADRRADIPFEAWGGAGPQYGRLTCGQRFIWDIIADLAPNDEHLNSELLLDVPGGTELEVVLRSVRALVERHASLRTLYTVDEEGEPVQQAHARGTIPVAVIDTEEDAERVAEETARASAGERFCLDTELPVRFSVVTQEGAPRVLVLVLSHIVVDIWGLRLLVEQTGRLLEGQHPDDVLPADPWQPLDQLAYEESPAGRRKLERAHRFLRESLAYVPAGPFPDSARVRPQPNRYWMGELLSQAPDKGARLLARHLGVSASSVLIAVAAITLHRLCGVTEFGFSLRTLNRYDARTQTAVGHYSQELPLVLRRLDRELPDMAGEVQRSAVSMLRCPYYWPPEMRRIREEAVPPARSNATINYIGKPGGGSAEAEDIPAAELLSDAGNARFRWLFEHSEEKIQFLLSSHPRSLSCLVDTAFLPPELAERYLRTVQDSLVDLALSAVHGH